MADLSTTRMMNLLTLVLVTLPGLTFSFSYKRGQSDLHNYLRDLLRSQSDQRGKSRGTLGEDIGVCCNMKKRSEGQKPNPELPSEGKYVCCNQPYTPPTPPHLSQSNMRSLILTLAKRDDRDAPYRESWMDASRRMGDSGASLSNIPGAREGGSYVPASEAARRDPLLTGIMHLLRTSGRHRPASFVSPEALSSSAGDSPRPVDFEAAALVSKREPNAAVADDN